MHMLYRGYGCTVVQVEHVVQDVPVVQGDKVVQVVHCTGYIELQVLKEVHVVHDILHVQEYLNVAVIAVGQQRKKRFRFFKN